MKLCIITDDKMISKDDEAYSGLDISCIPPTVHALQWHETAGEIEYKNTAPNKKPENEFITSLPSWANTALIIWNDAKVAKAQKIQDAIDQAKDQPISQGAQNL